MHKNMNGTVPDVFQSHHNLSVVNLEDNYFTGVFPKMPAAVTQCTLYPNNAFTCYQKEDSVCSNKNIAGMSTEIFTTQVCTTETRPEALRTTDCMAMNELLPLDRVSDIACCQIRIPKIQVTCDENLRVTSLYANIILTNQTHLCTRRSSSSAVSKWNSRKYWKYD